MNSRILVSFGLQQFQTEVFEDGDFVPGSFHEAREETIVLTAAPLPAHAVA
jgi:hypothetical protein